MPKNPNNKNKKVQKTNRPSKNHVNEDDQFEPVVSQETRNALLKNKAKKKLQATTPWYLSTPVMVGVGIVVVSILLTWEPVAQFMDANLGTTTSQRNLAYLEEQRHMDGKIVSDATSFSMMNVAAEQRCLENPGSCQPAPESEHESFTITLINESRHRADIHWDNGNTGQVVSNVEAGATLSMTVFRDNEFFITRHGVRETLVDPRTDIPHKFKTTQQDMVFVLPANSQPSTNKCQDRLPVCNSYARQGTCWESPGWMIVNCCASCERFSTLEARRLVDYEVRCSKENMNITDPVWQPGDLDALFRRWATSPEFQQYEPQILSSPDSLDGDGKPAPWVMTFDNFFDFDEAQALIEGGQMAGFDRSTNQGRVNAQGEMEMVTSTTRTSSNAWCLGECQQLPGVVKMTQRIEAVTGIPSKNYEPFQVLEYQDNQFYKMHHDSEGRDLKPPGNRILTFFLYLSNVEEGGETKFNKLGIQVKPKLGRALVWPSVLNEEPDFWDDRMYHEAMPVIKGQKYAANHWIHLNDYEGPNKWGCTGSFK